MNKKKSIYKRVFLIVMVVIIFTIIYLIWGISSAIKISTHADQVIFSSLNNIVMQTVRQLPRSNKGFVNGFKANNQDSQKISQMNKEINLHLAFVKNLPISSFSYSVDSKFMGPSVLRVDLNWSYTVYRLSWPLAKYSQDNELILEHASNGTIWSLDQSGKVIPPSQYITN